MTKELKEIRVYSTAAGDIPKFVRKQVKKTFVEYDQFLAFKEEIVKILTDRSHTQYQNECYLNFLFSKVGLK